MTSSLTGPQNPSTNKLSAMNTGLRNRIVFEHYKSEKNVYVFLIQFHQSAYLGSLPVLSYLVYATYLGLVQRYLHRTRIFNEMKIHKEHIGR